jgi:hypothetical protein
MRRRKSGKKKQKKRRNKRRGEEKMRSGQRVMCAMKEKQRKGKERKGSVVEPVI